MSLQIGSKLRGPVRISMQNGVGCWQVASQTQRCGAVPN